MLDQPKHVATDEVLVILIRKTVTGSSERRLAAKFLLSCLRRFGTREEIERCLNNLEHEALLDIASEARRLATEYGIIRPH
jgi:hypothetical protein